jgi:hypothetical protein
VAAAENGQVAAQRHEPQERRFKRLQRGQPRAGGQLFGDLLENAVRLEPRPRGFQEPQGIGGRRGLLRQFVAPVGDDVEEHVADPAQQQGQGAGQRHDRLTVTREAGLLRPVDRHMTPLAADLDAHARVLLGLEGVGPGLQRRARRRRARRVHLLQQPERAFVIAEPDV